MERSDRFASRLRFARQRWGWTQDELAREAQVGVATIRRAEGGIFEPRLETARRLAAALSVRLEWLLTGDQLMVSLTQMTLDEQRKARIGSRTGTPAGPLPPGSGPWYRDGDEWRVDHSRVERKAGRQ